MINKRAYTQEERERFYFMKGWRQLNRENRKKVKEEIKRALFLTSDITFYQRMKARVIPNILEYESIVAIFRKYGVNDCFGK